MLTMNVKNFVLLTLLFFIVVGTVSAQDNVTGENLQTTVEEINVTYEDVMWQENLSDITVELPDEASGEFLLKIDDEIIYNQTITEKSFRVPVKLPDKNSGLVINIYPPMDCRYYKLSAFYNNINLNLKTPLKIMKYSPDYNMLHFPSEILQYGMDPYLVAFPRSANGTVEYYIDDKLFNTTSARPFIYWDGNPFSKLPLGIHTFAVRYMGDEYYNPFNKTFNFTVTNVVIDIPPIINISHDDCISVQTLKDVTGTVKIYLDNILVYTQKTQSGEAIVSLEKYMKYTNHEVKVIFTSSKISRTKTQMVNMTYDFDVWLDYFIYGEKNIIEVLLPDTLDRNLLTIKIDGVKYKFTQPKYIENNMAAVDISKLGTGNHSMIVTFSGNNKFYALNKTYNFTIDYNFIAPSDIEYKDSSKAYLKLPADACGNLEVYVDGKLFKATKMINGYGEIKIDNLNPGNHDLTLKYTGEDYNVSEANSNLRVSPKVSLSYRFRQGENKYITLEVPKACSGYVVFTIDDKIHKVKIVNGIAKYSMKKLKIGEHDIYVDYYGNDGVEDYGIWRVVTVLKPLVKMTLKKVKVKKSSKKLTITATLKINGKLAKGKYVKFKFNKKTYKVKTNKKGIAKLIIKKSVLKKLKIGKKVRYTASYYKVTVKKTAKVRK